MADHRIYRCVRGYQENRCLLGCLFTAGNLSVGSALDAEWGDAQDIIENIQRALLEIAGPIFARKLGRPMGQPHAG